MMNSSGSSDYAVLKQQMSEEQISLFVRRLAQQEIEFEDFKAHFTQLNNLKAQTERQLKSKVFTNYKHFIDTAKEIKRLDSETKNIGDILSDQSQTLSALNKALSQVSNSDLFNMKFEPSGNSVNSRLNTEVSGLNLPVNDSRSLLAENTVDEIDFHTNRPRQKLCVFMLSDGILTTRFSPVENPFSSCKLICVEFYLFNSISIEQSSSTVIKAIVYPEPVILQFEKSTELKTWMDLFTQGKKRAQMNQGALNRRRSSAETDVNSSGVFSSSRRGTTASNSSSTYNERGAIVGGGGTGSVGAGGSGGDLFIYDIPAHLDVSIALKDYEACLKYLKEADDFFKENEALFDDGSIVQSANAHNSSLGRVKESIDEKRELLISTLREELSIEPLDKNSFGQPDTSGAFRLINMPGSFGKRTGQLKAASALVKLGYTNEACHLFLKSTSLNLRRVLLQKLSVSIESLSSIATFVFNSLNLAAQDFQQMFSPYPSIFSCLSIWACDEVSHFCEQITQHFSRNNLLLDLTKLSNLVQAVMGDSVTLLADSGLEMSLFLEEGIEPLIRQSAEKVVNLVKQTLNEKSSLDSNWDCVKFEGTPESQSEQLTLFLKSMDDIGIDLLSLASESEDSVAVCPISISFFRLLMPICQDLALISKFGNRSIPIKAIHDLVGLYIATLTTRLGSLDEQNENYEYEKELILLQLEVFRDYVLISLVEVFSNYSNGTSIDFDVENTRISSICSTLADVEINEEENEDVREETNA